MSLSKSCKCSKGVFKGQHQEFFSKLRCGGLQIPADLLIFTSSLAVLAYSSIDSTKKVRSSDVTSKSPCYHAITPYYLLPPRLQPPTERSFLRRKITRLRPKILRSSISRVTMSAPAWTLETSLRSLQSVGLQGHPSGVFIRPRPSMLWS